MPNKKPKIEILMPYVKPVSYDPVKMERIIVKIRDERLAREAEERRAKRRAADARRRVAKKAAAADAPAAP